MRVWYQKVVRRLRCLPLLAGVILAAGCGGDSDFDGKGELQVQAGDEGADQLRRRRRKVGVGDDQRRRHLRRQEPAARRGDRDRVVVPGRGRGQARVRSTEDGPADEVGSTGEVQRTGDIGVEVHDRSKDHDPRHRPDGLKAKPLKKEAHGQSSVGLMIAILSLTLRRPTLPAPRSSAFRPGGFAGWPSPKISSSGLAM